jgi:DNA invertase Pin-like site-specific DNA recombinase
MKCRLIGYRRVSTQKQGQSGLGLEAQDTAIGLYVRSSGCTLMATYTEVETGKRSDRPELARAMAHAKRIGATLVIAKLDRLARNVYFVSGLMESGVDFVACDNPTANRLTIHILAAVAEDEARRISERTKAALAAAKARGTKLGGKRPGQHVLTAEDRRKGGANGSESRSIRARGRAIDSYAELAPTIHQLRDEGLSLRMIADRLNTDGRKTRTGAAWSQVQVKRILDRSAE